MNKDEDEEMWTEDADQNFANSADFDLQVIAKNFSKQDYIMEPSIFLQLKRYLTLIACNITILIKNAVSIDTFKREESQN